MRAFFRQLRPAITLLVIATVVCGVIYPLTVAAVGRLVFPRNAEGSLVRVDNEVVGSSLIGQPFSAPQYFHPRPSAADDGYGGLGSSGSNLGPQNPEFLAAVAERVATYRTLNGLDPRQLVPVDAVTASGSGLDPMISVANAKLQVGRVAQTRGLSLDDVLKVLDDSIEGRPLGILGDNGVNVLRANVALDKLASARL